MWAKINVRILIFTMLLYFCKSDNQNFENILKNEKKKKKKKAWRYYPFTQAHHKLQSYDVGFLRYGARRTEFFCHFGPFLPFYPTNNPDNKISEKLKKTPGHIIILKMCTINENHIMYGSETWRATDIIKK